MGRSIGAPFSTVSTPQLLVHPGCSESASTCREGKSILGAAGTCDVQTRHVCVSTEQGPLLGLSLASLDVIRVAWRQVLTASGAQHSVFLRRTQHSFVDCTTAQGAGSLLMFAQKAAFAGFTHWGQACVGATKLAGSNVGYKQPCMSGLAGVAHVTWLVCIYYIVDI